MASNTKSTFRKQVIEAVLATDLRQHFSHVSVCSQVSFPLLLIRCYLSSHCHSQVSAFKTKVGPLFGYTSTGTSRAASEYANSRSLSHDFHRADTTGVSSISGSSSAGHDSISDEDVRISVLQVEGLGSIEFEFEKTY